MVAFNKIILIIFAAFLQEMVVCDRCPSSWISWGHSCYRFELEELASFNDAEAKCIALGLEGRPSHLASIHGKEEQKFIYEVYRLAMRKETQGAWSPRILVGLLVGNSASKVSWTDGSCVDYKNWYRGYEPNNFPQSAATISNGNGKQGHWCDQHVIHRYHFVCKMPQN